MLASAESAPLSPHMLVCMRNKLVPQSPAGRAGDRWAGYSLAPFFIAAAVAFAMQHGRFELKQRFIRGWHSTAYPGAIELQCHICRVASKVTRHSILSAAFRVSCFATTERPATYIVSRPIDRPILLSCLQRGCTTA